MSHPPPPPGYPPPPIYRSPPPTQAAQRQLYRPGNGPPLVLSGWWARVGAVVLDSLIIGVAWLIAFLVVALALGVSLTRDREAVQVVSSAIGLLLGLGYPALLLSRGGERNGQTWGKQALGIRVIRDDGRPLTVGVAVLREGVGKQLLTIVTFYAYALVDYLWPLGNRENQALHDKLASTHVVVASPAAISTASDPAPQPLNHRVPALAPAEYHGFAPPSPDPDPYEGTS